MKKDLNTILKYTVKNSSDCLIWTRCFNSDGYHRAVFDGYSNGKVHRVVCELTTGLDLTGKVVRHTCDNPKCINPEHLVPGNSIENIKDRNERSSNGRAKLSKLEVVAARDLYSTGKYLVKDLAHMFKVNIRTMSSLLNRTHWKHVQ
jgi:hypothetical protein